MRALCTVGVLAVLVCPTPARARAVADVRNCAVADSVVGSPTDRQRRAPIRRGRGSDGREFVRTGTSRLSTSGLMVWVWWTPDLGADDARGQLEVRVPTRLLLREGIERDTVFIEIDEWMKAPLGVPTPPILQGSHVPQSLPMSVALDMVDVGLLARATQASVRYAGRTFRFSATDLASVNALYRVVRCAGGPA